MLIGNRRDRKHLFLPRRRSGNFSEIRRDGESIGRYAGLYISPFGYDFNAVALDFHADGEARQLARAKQACHFRTPVVKYGSLLCHGTSVAFNRLVGQRAGFYAGRRYGCAYRPVYIIGADRRRRNAFGLLGQAAARFGDGGRAGFSRACCSFGFEICSIIRKKQKAFPQIGPPDERALFALLAPFLSEHFARTSYASHAHFAACSVFDSADDGSRVLVWLSSKSFLLRRRLGAFAASRGFEGRNRDRYQNQNASF
jgi:hypothetical protein